MAKRENSVYISADGRVYPCCDIGYHFNETPAGMFGSSLELQLKYQDNKINKWTLSQIINGNFSLK